MKINFNVFYIEILKDNILSLLLLQACLNCLFFYSKIVSAKKINVWRHHRFMTQMKTNITGILHRDDKGQRPISTPVTSLSTIVFWVFL